MFRGGKIDNGDCGAIEAWKSSQTIDFGPSFGSFRNFDSIF